jgi:hypothetical protein
MYACVSKELALDGRKKIGEKMKSELRKQQLDDVSGIARNFSLVGSPCYTRGRCR